MHGHFPNWLCSWERAGNREAVFQKKRVYIPGTCNIEINKAPAGFCSHPPPSFPPLRILSSMINGPRPPRDAPPLAEPPNVTRNDIGRGVDFSGCVTGWDVNAVDGDLPQERRPQSSSPPFRQGYPPTNTNDSGSNPPGRETAVDAARPAVS